MAHCGMDWILALTAAAVTLALLTLVIKGLDLIWDRIAIAVRKFLRKV